MKKLKKKSSILFPLSLLWVLVFLSCDVFTYKRPFPDEYYDANFISHIGFNVFVGDEGPALLPLSGTVSGAWDFAYRYEDGWNDEAYITLDQIDDLAESGYGFAGGSSYGGSLPQGLSASSPVYRLEVVNLITGGDFEAGVSGTWVPSSTASSDFSTIGPISGTGSMRLSAPQGEEITYTPIITTGFTLGTNRVYNVFFRASPSASFNVAAGLMLGYDPPTGIVKDSYTSNGSPLLFDFTPLTGNSFDNLLVDDFMLSKSGGTALRLHLSPTQTIPALESGVYSFSVWARKDHTASPNGDPHDLDTFTITMRSLSPATLSSESESYAPTDSWVRLRVVLSGLALQFPQTNESVLELLISFDASRVGRVLLADPQLVFYPDYPSGY